MISAHAFRAFNSEANGIEHTVMPKVQSPKSKVRNRLPAENSVPTATARIAALRMLARRELSESQIRQRLARRGHAQDDIDAAVERLKADRAIDDSRVAGAIARTETSLKRRGKRRIAQEMHRAGIAPALARHAIEETFSELDENVLIDAALSKRLRHGRPIADEKEFLRLYRYLMAQGFESDRVLAALSRRRGTVPEP